jgi:undecaprenyl-phosphate 4-deoxy-4-formamido-L-arabinose transferase
MRASLRVRRPAESVQRLAIVIPVYQGERTLEDLLREIEPLTRVSRTPSGVRFTVTQLILVHDNGPDDSDLIMQELAARHPFVRTVWLSGNFGQHPALLAGMAGGDSDWLVTMDEDGQHDPGDIGKMLEVALAEGTSLVYARPTNPPPHGRIRNACSALAKWLAGAILGGPRLRWFHSFRLVRGEIARSLAKTCITHVYLDVALSWLLSRSSVCPVRMRSERGRKSGFTFRSLIGHFWRLVLACGAKPIRWVAILALSCLALTVGLGGFALWAHCARGTEVSESVAITIGLSGISGIVLLSLAVLAEYVSVVIAAAMGKPLFMTLEHPVRILERTSEPAARDEAEVTSGREF